MHPPGDSREREGGHSSSFEKGAGVWGTPQVRTPHTCHNLCCIFRGIFCGSLGHNTSAHTLAHHVIVLQNMPVFVLFLFHFRKIQIGKNISNYLVNILTFENRCQILAFHLHCKSTPGPRLSPFSCTILFRFQKNAIREGMYHYLSDIFTFDRAWPGSGLGRCQVQGQVLTFATS